MLQFVCIVEKENGRIEENGKCKQEVKGNGGNQLSWHFEKKSLVKFQLFHIPLVSSRFSCKVFRVFPTENFIFEAFSSKTQTAEKIQTSFQLLEAQVFSYFPTLTIFHRGIFISIYYDRSRKLVHESSICVKLI
jgi:hypothetical protein